MKLYIVGYLVLFCQNFENVFAKNAIHRREVYHINTLTNDSKTNIYCEETTTLIGNQNLTWNKTRIGTPAYPNEFCSDENGIIPYRDCSGDYHPSSKWEPVIGNCSGHFKTSNITNILHQWLVKYALGGLGNYELLQTISRRIEEYTCIDLYLLSKALYYMTIEEDAWYLIKFFYFESLDNTLEIFKRLDGSCPHIGASSYILGAVNIFFYRVLEEDITLQFIVRPNFIFQMSFPFLDNITGLSLYKNTNESFTDYSIKKIYINESYDDMLLENLELSAYVPNDLFATLSTTLSDKDKLKFNVIIVALSNNKLFNLGENTEVVSKVIGVSLAGLRSKGKAVLFDIYSKPLTNKTSETYGEWFTVNNDDIYVDEIITECKYPPVTYMFLYDKEDPNQSCKKSDKFPYAEFSVCASKITTLSLHNQNPVFDILSSLSVSINYAQPQTVIEALYKRHQIILKSFMLIGCTLSLFGLLATTLTLIFIKNWHKKRMYSIQLQVAMAFETFLFLIDSDISYITYVILYYFILSQFSWMMLIGYTQYVKFVKVFDDKSLNMLKSSLIGWLLPAIVIVIPIAVHPDCLYCEFCSAKRNILIFAVMVPTSIVILINMTIYMLVMIHISKSKAKDYTANSNISTRTTKVGFLLPFLLGITWIFVFALVSPWRWFSLAGSYLFHIIAPLQAFVLFIFVVAMDENTRKEWKSHWNFLTSKIPKKKNEKDKDNKKEKVAKFQNQVVTIS